MQVDGEWRVQFITDDKSTVPYQTAPFPVADSIAGQYGVGEVAGTVIGIPKNAPHPEAAWKFVRFVTTDTATVVEYANLFGNVPTTKDAAASPDLKFPAQFQTFLDVYANESSRYKPLNVLGAADQDLITEYLGKIQRKPTTDAEIISGLSGIAKNIDDELARAG
jgi:multiple sugar transport system substrate-binding protein